MPKRSRSGPVSSPVRVVAPIRVNLFKGSLNALAPAPSPITMSNVKLSVRLDEGGAGEIARRARGTPRIANRLLRRVRDFAEVEGDGRVTMSVADRALQRLEVDAAGLDAMDRKILVSLIDKFGGGPVGLETLAMATGERADTLEDVYEPYLLMEGYLARTPRGRVATQRAFEHLGRKMPSGLQGSLL